MFVTLAIALAVSLVSEPISYAKPNLLIEPAALLKEAAKFHILDLRSAGPIAEGRIPDAVAVELSKWSRTMTEGKADAAYWKQALQVVGVTPDKPTVVYGSDMKEVCRGWWLMKYAGVKDVRVLNGGYEGFLAAGGKPSKDAPKVGVPAFDWKLDTERFAAKADVLTSVADKARQIVDGRSTGEFTGTTASAKKKGHVPGANNLEWSEFLDAKASRFKSAEDLAKLIATHKIDLAKPCTAYCQSGGRSSVVSFGLELIGAKDVRNYYRSWAEWGNAEDTPVEK